MSSSLHTRRYQVFRELLVDARHQAHLRQSDLAEQLGKPQSFVSKFERGERRLDFTEFMGIAEVLGLDVQKFIALYNQRLTTNGGVGDSDVPHRDDAGQVGRADDSAERQ